MCGITHSTHFNCLYTRIIKYNRGVVTRYLFANLVQTKLVLTMHSKHSHPTRHLKLSLAYRPQRRPTSSVIQSNHSHAGRDPLQPIAIQSRCGFEPPCRVNLFECGFDDKKRAVMFLSLPLCLCPSAKLRLHSTSPEQNTRKEQCLRNSPSKLVSVNIY